VRRTSAAEPSAVWIDELTAADVPVEPLRSVAEAAERGRLAGRATVVEADGERQVRFPVLRDGEPMSRAGAAPALGADGEEILAAAGLNAEEIAELRNPGPAPEGAA
jgi:crotonobetainyl-CoA:carnitine CoA-transferase CaiB-like acyl-CoA transferase